MNGHELKTIGLAVGLLNKLINKEEQKRRLIEMMEADEKDGLYEEEPQEIPQFKGTLDSLDEITITTPSDSKEELRDFLQ